MPYVEIKAFPKVEEVKNKVAEKINAVFLAEWGCPQDAISISFEEVEPESWEQQVGKPLLEKNVDKMKIYKGEKKY